MKFDRQTVTSLHYWHYIVLFAGFTIGIAAAYGISLLPLSSGSDLHAARKLGIVSLTTLEGYSKSADILNYLALISLPTGFAMAAWYLWCRGERYERLCLIFEDAGLPERSKKKWLPFAVGCAVLFLSFNINYFYRPIVGWTFLGEEGINLVAASSIMDGGAYSREFSNGYGPMMLYPLAWLMKTIGVTVLTDRIYTYLLNLVAYSIIGLFFYRTMHNRLVFAISTLLFFAVFHPFVAVSPNTTYLRVALGLLTLLLAGQYVTTHKRYLLWTTGIVVGQGLLFSQEVGICAIIAILALFFIKNTPKRQFWRFFLEVTQLGLGCMASLLPMFLYFAWKGVLASALYEMIYLPKLYTMGYSALKFPSMTALFTEPIASQALFPYWIILVYLLTALALLPQLLMGKMTARNLTALAVLVFGVLLFRSALCRSDLYHLFFASQPAFVLLFLLLDRAASASIRLEAACSNAWKWGKITTLCLFFSLPFLIPQYRTYTLGNAMKYGLNFGEKWSKQETGYQLLQNRTGGVPIGEELVGSIAKIGDFLSRNTSPDEYIYFFPNEAGYYFLFDRKNPTRYSFSYQAITTEQREEIIHDLELKKPRFVIYSRRVWLIDNIQPGLQVPELVNYFNKHYTPYQDMDEILVLKRVAS